jgi:hypothetical protein
MRRQGNVRFGRIGMRHCLVCFRWLGYERLLGASSRGPLLVVTNQSAASPRNFERPRRRMSLGASGAWGLGHWGVPLEVYPRSLICRLEREVVSAEPHRRNEARAGTAGMKHGPEPAAGRDRHRRTQDGSAPCRPVLKGAQSGRRGRVGRVAGGGKRGTLA